MERFYFSEKRILLIFAALLAGVALFTVFPARDLVPHNMTAYCYCTIIFLWAQTVRLRITDRKVRRRILLSCMFMILLFFFRMCKFSYFPNLVYVNEMIWYAYYIPMTAIPLCVFLAALYVEPTGPKERVAKTERILIVVEVLICIVVMTNYYHGLVFKIRVHPDKDFTHNVFYYILVAWMALLGIGTVVHLFRKCSFSAARRLWYIPAIFIIAGSALSIWYLIYGGAPKIGGVKLFHFHEAYCLPFVTATESMIMIGLIPANTGYGKLFDYSWINACIFDREQHPVYTSKNWTPEIADEDHRSQSFPVSGGSVTWIENLSVLNRLNRELEEVTEELADENELIRQENKLRAERTSFETKNRLYNRIAAAVRSRALRTQEILGRTGRDEEEFREDLIYATVLGAYIKRMGNLMLLTESGGRVPGRELVLAITESMEYIRQKGCLCELQTDGEKDISSALSIIAYELFETAVEDAWFRLGTLFVSLDLTDGFEMVIALDATAEGITCDWKDREVEAAGGKLFIRYEDETYYIRLTAEEKKPEDGGAS